MRKQLRALVVDDDPSLLTLVKAMLERKGMDIVACPDPRKAISTAVECMPDAIVLDLIMPGLSGFQLLEHFQHEPATRGIPVLILSAKDESFDRVRGLKAGAEDYLAKPFDPEELFIRLRRLVENKRVNTSVLLRGRLGPLAAGDILQQALASKVSGVLELSGPPPASVTMADGTIASARYGELEGESALIVFLQRRTGQFQLVERPEAAARRDEPLSLNGTLMLLAWIEDELERRRSLIPPPHAPLTAKDTGVVPDSECGHLERVLDWFRRNEGAGLARLEEAMLVAPPQARLATVLLLEAGLLQLQDPGVSQPAPRPEAAGEPSHPRLDTACSRLVRRAETLGFAPDVLHVLVGIDPQRWEPFLEEMVGGIPDSLIDRPKQRLLGELRRDGSASVRIPCSQATLLFHIHRLEGIAGLRARAFLAMTSAVVLVPSTIPNSQTTEIAQAVVSLERPPAMLLLPPGQGFAREYPCLTPWKTSEDIPESLEALLEQLS